MKERKQFGRKISLAEAEYISPRVFTPTIWIEHYGRHFYDIQTTAYAIKILQADGLEEWSIIESGGKYFIFLEEGKKAKKKLRTKLLPEQISRIRTITFDGNGNLKRLANELGFSESYISRVHRRLRRKNAVIPSNYDLPERVKKTLYISLTLVKNFLSSAFTIAEYQKTFGQTTNIYKKCANIGSYQLPEGWCAVRICDFWMIYKLLEEIKVEIANDN